MGNEHTDAEKAPNDSRVYIVVGSVLAGIVVVFMIVGAIVNGVQQREHDERISDMTNDRLNSCFDTGDC